MTPVIADLLAVRIADGLPGKALEQPAQLGAPGGDACLLNEALETGQRHRDLDLVELARMDVEDARLAASPVLSHREPLEPEGQHAQIEAAAVRDAQSSDAERRRGDLEELLSPRRADPG